jgi:hypothetical protein
MTYRSCATHTGGTEMWICVAFPDFDPELD